MPLTLLPAAPARTDAPAVFIAKSDAHVASLSTLVTEFNAEIGNINAIGAGGAYALKYVFSTTTTDADPGAGFMRMDNATQNASTTLRLDVTGSDGIDVTSLIDSFDSSLSANKGQLRIVKTSDPSKWMAFNVTARAALTGYRNISVQLIGSSTASPFANNDSVVAMFTRTGDIGSAGTLNRRVVSITTAAAPTPNASVTDLYVVTALAETATFGAPTGTPVDGQSLMLRIKDNGTAKSLVFNAIYRASTNLPLPFITLAGKTAYLGFVYNSNAGKWDFIAYVENI